MEFRLKLVTIKNNVIILCYNIQSHITYQYQRFSLLLILYAFCSHIPYIGNCLQGSQPIRCNSSGILQGRGRSKGALQTVGIHYMSHPTQTYYLYFLDLVSVSINKLMLTLIMRFDLTDGSSSLNSLLALLLSTLILLTYLSIVR